MELVKTIIHQFSELSVLDRLLVLSSFTGLTLFSAVGWALSVTRIGRLKKEIEGQEARERRLVSELKREKAAHATAKDEAQMRDPAKILAATKAEWEAGNYSKYEQKLLSSSDDPELLSKLFYRRGMYYASLIPGDEEGEALDLAMRWIGAASCLARENSNASQLSWEIDRLRERLNDTLAISTSREWRALDESPSSANRNLLAWYKKSSDRGLTIFANAIAARMVACTGGRGDYRAELMSLDTYLNSSWITRESDSFATALMKFRALLTKPLPSKDRVIFDQKKIFWEAIHLRAEGDNAAAFNKMTEFLNDPRHTSSFDEVTRYRFRTVWIDMGILAGQSVVEEARQCARQLEHKYGPIYDLTLTAKYYLGKALAARGQHGEARQLAEEILPHKIRLKGARHIDVASISKMLQNAKAQTEGSGSG